MYPLSVNRIKEVALKHINLYPICFFLICDKFKRDPPTERNVIDLTCRDKTWYVQNVQRMHEMRTEKYWKWKIVHECEWDGRQAGKQSSAVSYLQGLFLLRGVWLAVGYPKANTTVYTNAMLAPGYIIGNGTVHSFFLILCFINPHQTILPFYLPVVKWLLLGSCSLLSHTISRSQAPRKEHVPAVLNDFPRVS